MGDARRRREAPAGASPGSNGAEPGIGAPAQATTPEASGPAEPDAVDRAIAEAAAKAAEKAEPEVHPLPEWCAKRLAALSDQMGKLQVAFNECFTSGVLADGVDLDTTNANLTPDGKGYTRAARTAVPAPPGGTGG